MAESDDTESDIHERNAEARRAEATMPLDVPRRPPGNSSVSLLTFSIPPGAEAVDASDGLSVDW